MSAQGNNSDLEEERLALTHEQRQAKIDMELKRIFENEAQAKKNTKLWLEKLELIVTFKRYNGGVFLTTNKYSELVKQIIFAIIPRENRRWVKETFEWHIFNKIDSENLKDAFNENKIKFLVITI
jgi:hypothetical protein